MKQLLTLLTLLLIFSSCDKKHISNDFELRQLVQESRITQSSSATYFIFMGTYSSSTKYEEKIKMFAKVDGLYQFIEVDLNKIRINIDNNIKKPYINIVSHSEGKTLDGQDYVRHLQYRFRNSYLIINCPEQYLPEKLTSIKL